MHVNSTQFILSDISGYNLEHKNVDFTTSVYAREKRFSIMPDSKWLAKPCKLFDTQGTSILQTGTWTAARR